MQVMFFVTQLAGEERKKLLVLPAMPSAAIPPAMQEDWHYFATVDIGDSLIAAPAAKVASDIDRQGYSLVEPTG